VVTTLASKDRLDVAPQVAVPPSQSQPHAAWRLAGSLARTRARLLLRSTSYPMYCTMGRPSGKSHQEYFEALRYNSLPCWQKCVGSSSLGYLRLQERRFLAASRNSTTHQRAPSSTYCTCLSGETKFNAFSSASSSYTALLVTATKRGPPKMRLSRGRRSSYRPSSRLPVYSPSDTMHMWPTGGE